MKHVLLFILLLIPSVSYAPSIPEADTITYFEQYEERLHKTEQYRMFKNALAWSESRCNSEAWNKYGYIGKYQLGYAARVSTGYGHIHFRDFIRDPGIWSESDQEVAMDILVYKNWSHIYTIFATESEVVIHGVTCTPSGLIAAAHLSGAYGVRRWISTGYNPRDAYGTSLTDYINRFNGYKFLNN